MGREGGGLLRYVLRTAHPGAVEYDHGTLYAEITSQLFPQPRKVKKSREVRRVDRKKWEEEAAEWASRVRSRGMEPNKGREAEDKGDKGVGPPTEEEAREELRRWTTIARAELPRKEIRIGGEKRRKAGNTSFKGASAPHTADERDRKRVNRGARQGEKR